MYNSAKINPRSRRPINDGSNNTKQNLPLPEHRLQAKPTLIYTQPRPGRYIKGTLCSTLLIEYCKRLCNDQNHSYSTKMCHFNARIYRNEAKRGKRLGHFENYPWRPLFGGYSMIRRFDWNQNNLLRTLTLPMNNLVATVHWSLFYFLPARRRPNISTNLFLTIISSFKNDYNEEIWGKKSLSPAMVDGGVCKGAQLCLHFVAISFQSGSDWSEQRSVLSNWPRGQMGSRQFDQ